VPLASSATSTLAISFHLFVFAPDISASERSFSESRASLHHRETMPPFVALGVVRRRRVTSVRPDTRQVSVPAGARQILVDARAARAVQPLLS
jgi:hypothetical protein